MALGYRSAISFVKRHFILLAVFLFVIILGAGYLSGYRTGPGLTFVRVGTLEVTGLPDGANVYTDEASRGIARGGSLGAALVPGTHSVIVDVSGDEPWEKIVTITSNQTTQVSPILVPKKPVLVRLSGDAAATTTAAAFAQQVPTIVTPLVMGCQDVYVDDNRVTADALPAASSTPACTTPDYLCVGGTCEATVVFSPASLITSLVPFPGRTDAVIVSAGASSYVLGLDPRTPQFFAPFTSGVAPIVVPEDDSSVYVVDDGEAYSVSF